MSTQTKLILILPYFILDLLILAATGILFFIPYVLLVADGHLPLIKRLEK